MLLLQPHVIIVIWGRNVKADLDGKTFAYNNFVVSDFCSTCYSFQLMQKMHTIFEHVSKSYIVSQSAELTELDKISCVPIHFLKTCTCVCLALWTRLYDILHFVHNNLKEVEGLI